MEEVSKFYAFELFFLKCMSWFQIGGVLSSNMEQLNKKRNDLVGQQKVLNGKIATREEKQAYLTERKNELEAR